MQPITMRLMLPLLLLALPAAAADPQALLERMSMAVEGRDYHGTLVYMQPGMAETFHVYHRMDEGVSTERLVSLDGAGAEIIRTREEVICIFPAERRVVVDKRRIKQDSENPLRALLPGYSPALQTNYDLQLMPGSRMVGRPAITLSIEPRDEFRYGYRIWVDEASAMPLKIQLLDQDANMPVEELFFASIFLPEALSKELMRPAVETADFAWIRHGKSDSHITTKSGKIMWRVAKLPAGFMQTAATLEYMADNRIPRTHLVYSDGLASVSVFIDTAVAAAEQAEGLATMGAANAYTLMLDDQMITAMGEVPAQTVHLIATSVEPAQDSE
jgi:sigma-E factor negative regulatory protein RseB